MLILAYWLHWYISLTLWQIVKNDLCVECFKNTVWISGLDFAFGLSPPDQCIAEQSLSNVQANKAIEGYGEGTGNHSCDSVHNTQQRCHNLFVHYWTKVACSIVNMPKYVEYRTYTTGNITLESDGYSCVWSALTTRLSCLGRKSGGNLDNSCSLRALLFRDVKGQLRT